MSKRNDMKQYSVFMHNRGGGSTQSTTTWATTGKAAMNKVKRDYPGKTIIEARKK